MATDRFRHLGYGAIYAFLTRACGFGAAGYGHGSYLFLIVVSAPLGILGFQLGLGATLAIFSPFLLWPGIAVLHRRSCGGDRQPVFVGVMMVHYAGNAIVPFTGWFREDRVYLHRHWPEISLLMVTGLFIYVLGQLLLWWTFARSRRSSELR